MNEIWQVETRYGRATAITGTESECREAAKRMSAMGRQPGYYVARRIA